jgi:hypothetical protein
MGCRPCCMDKRDTNITVNFDNMANDSNSPINIKNDSISSFQGNNTSRSNNDNVALN